MSEKTVQESEEISSTLRRSNSERSPTKTVTAHHPQGRKRYVSFRLAESERTRIERAAESEGVTVTEFLRSSVLRSVARSESRSGDNHGVS